MRDAIVEKLGAVLSGDIDSECKVVYVLCESRKLLDKYPPKPVPFALRLYCHWALHVDLTHRNTTMPFLEQVDGLAESVLAGSSDPQKESQVFREFLYWDTFREQLRQFLGAFDLPTSVCDDEPQWSRFLKNYARVVEDGSLSCNAKNTSLKCVSYVVFNGCAPRNGAPIEGFPFQFWWDIFLKDGRKMSVTVKAKKFPTGEPLLAYSITLPATC